MELTRSRQRTTSVLDQVVSSGRSFVFLVLAARTLDANAFGYVAVLVTLTIGANEMLRAAASHPLAIEFHDVAAGDDRPLGAAVGYHLQLAVAVAAVGTLGSALLAPGPDGALVVGFALYPAVAGQDALRVGSLNRGRADRALAVDLVWLLLLVPTMMIALDNRPTAFTAVLCWGATAAIAAVAVGASAHLPLSGAASAAYRRRIGRLGAALAGQVALETVPTRLMPVLIAVLVSARAAGAVRGAEVLFGATTVIYSGLALVALRQARLLFEAGPPEQAFTYLARTFGLAVAVLVGNIGVVLMLPEGLGRELLGESWTGARDLAIPVGLLFAALIGLALVTVMLRAALSIGLLYRVVALAAALSVVAVPVATLAGGARAGVLADAGAVLVAVIVGLLVIRSRFLVEQPTHADRAGRGHGEGPGGRR